MNSDSTETVDPRIFADIRRLEPALSAELLESMRSQALSEISADRGVLARIRALPTARRRALLLGFLASVTVLALMGGGTPSLVLSFAAIAAVSLFASLRPIHRPEAPLWMRVALPASAFAVAVGSALVMPAGSAPLKASLSCFLPGLGVALVVVGVTWLIRRDVLRFTHIAGAAGAGLAANAFLSGRCPLAPQLEHQLLGHASIVVLLLASSWAFGLVHRRML